MVKTKHLVRLLARCFLLALLVVANCGMARDKYDPNIVMTKGYPHDQRKKVCY